jgi:hypothetical protein
LPRLRNNPVNWISRIRRDTDESAAPGNREVGSQVAILEDGLDPRVTLVKGHQREWREIEAIRKLALKAFKDPAFDPEDADAKWNATERLKYAGRLFSVHNTAANALMVAQEGERRAHGFETARPSASSIL